MPIRFYLHSKIPKDGLQLIYCAYTYKGTGTYRFSTGVKVSAKDWDAGRQVVRKTHPHHKLLNDRTLAPIRRNIETVALELRAYPHPMEPTAARVKEAMNHSKKEHSFWGCWDIYYENASKLLGKSSLSNYRITADLLRELEKRNGRLEFDDFTLTLYDRFLALLKERYGNTNTQAKRAQCLIKFLKHGIKEGWHSNDKYQFFKRPPRRAGKHIALNASDLEAIRAAPLDDPELEAVRDWFLFQCCIGLRVSDITRIRPEDIQGGKLSFYMKKGSDKRMTLMQLIIPEEAANIWEKNGGKLPPFTKSKNMEATATIYNKKIKVICRRAGLVDMVDTSDKGRVPKWQAVSSHTARRTCATRLYRLGNHITTIQNVLGHTKAATTETYIKASLSDFEGALLSMDGAK